MRKEDREIIRKIYAEEAKISDAIFQDNLFEGADQYERGFFKGLRETILAKCAYCVYIKHHMEVCPDSGCPLWGFMSAKRYKGRAIEDSSTK
jgi:hypothetical protein